MEMLRFSRSAQNRHAEAKGEFQAKEATGGLQNRDGVELPRFKDTPANPLNKVG